MKTCRKCNVEKSLEEFPTFKRVDRGGKLTVYSYCRVCQAAKNHLLYLKNIDIRKEKNKIYNENNKEKRRAKNREWVEANKEYVAKKQKEYREANKDILREKNRIRKKNRRHTDIAHKLYLDVKKRTTIFVRSRKMNKNERTKTLIGCDKEFLLNHLTSTWEKNYPGEELIWSNVHIDHIIPISTAKSFEDLKSLSHFSNLQLLKAKDNLLKGNKLFRN